MVDAADPRDELVELLQEQLRELHGVDPWASVVGSLTATAPPDSAPARAAPVNNPRPRGAMIDGGATQAIFRLLQDRPARWHRKQSIQWALPALTCKSIDWGLLALRRSGRIESRLAPGSRSYRLYRIRPVEATAIGQLPTTATGGTATPNTNPLREGRLPQG